MKFQRDILNSDKSTEVVTMLQQRLVDLVDLALQLKQAHWCVVGNNFRAVHLHLDEIILTVRDASDEVAERISTLGAAPDGRAQTVAEGSRLEALSSEFQKVPPTVTAVADRLQTTIAGLRESIGSVGELDPVSEDLLIGTAAQLEKHLWMTQAQEV